MTTEDARTVMEWCDILGGYSEEPTCLTRPFASAMMRQANKVVATWMQDAGMTVQQDAIGNLIGRYEARSATAKTLLLGSHLDTVRDAGKYDGPLGVMIALACVRRLHQRQERLPFAIEVLGFADEEGLRYQSAYLGSRAITGTFDQEALSLTDAEGIPMAEAIRAFGGNPDPHVLRTPRWRRDELVGYCEVHIEQGPVLEAQHLPVAVVSAIAGQSRIIVKFTGEAGHAGTVPMSLRHDAFCAAAEFALAVESVARALPGVVATVGQVSVQPGASNVIPGQVTLSLDVRHQDDAAREQACRQLEERARAIQQTRGVSANWQLLQEHRAVPCAPELTRLLARTIEEVGYPLLSLPSGAGHDAAVLAELTDSAMLFVRCRGGVSHNPAESVTQEDVAIAIETLEQFLRLLALEI
ncbi:MAG TPA: allantoate amidohydrolase [Ktedonobacteraceae bacterium]|nr:allantoate amidohydrolase [Ktedonobacteraceae bacterium]